MYELLFVLIFFLGGGGRLFQSGGFWRESTLELVFAE